MPRGHDIIFFNQLTHVKYMFTLKLTPVNILVGSATGHDIIFFIPYTRPIIYRNNIFLEKYIF